MAINFPNISRKLKLGVGLDMPWGDSFGFDIKENKPTAKVLSFIDNYKTDFGYGFISCHPKNREQLNAEQYFPAFKEFFHRAQHFEARSLHHTFLNLASMETYHKEKIYQFTNELIKALDLKWINEDLGIWSMKGKTLPYPVAPYLTDEGLESCIVNLSAYQKNIDVPVLVEFPGFTDGFNFYVGRIHAFDYFNSLAIETASPVTLDTGHLISYQWLQGKRGEELYSDLHRLPLEHCFEIHLSGCQIVNDRFMDFHHGIIMNEQIELLHRLLPLCPNLKAITYEDPKFDHQGQLIAKSIKNFNRLKEIVTQWQRDL